MDHRRVLREHLLKMDMFVGRFDRMAAWTIDELQADEFKQMAAERLFQESADCAVNIAKRLLRSESVDPGDSAREAFESLRARAIIDGQLADDLTKLYGTRNRVVHEYLPIDTEEMRQGLVDAASTVKRFLTCVLARVGAPAAPGSAAPPVPQSDRQF